jgi:hypothetical protein
VICLYCVSSLINIFESVVAIDWNPFVLRYMFCAKLRKLVQYNIKIITDAGLMVRGLSWRPNHSEGPAATPSSLRSSTVYQTQAMNNRYDFYV